MKKPFLLLLVPALLMLAACHSSKKVTGNKRSKTDPVTTVTTPSSSGKKPDKQDPDPSRLQVPVGSNFTSRVRVTITQNGRNITTTGTLRMRYDDVIQLTLVDPMVGMMEVGRMELSPDNVLIIDRVNKRYVSTTYEDFAALKSRSIDFATIQTFFWKEAQQSDQLSYTIPTSKSIKLDLKLSDKGNAANWTPHTRVSDKYAKTDPNELFRSMLGQ